MVDQAYKLSKEFTACAGLVSQGSANAISGMAQMLGQDITVTSLRVAQIPVREAANLVGGYEALSVGVYLTVSGSATGHMFMIYPPATALGLVDLLMGQPPGTTTSLDEMEESALAELGNVTGSFFLNALADATGSTFLPSPPAVMMDMAGAILDVALADIMEVSEDALVVETNFGTADQQINGSFLVMPSPDLMRVLLESLESEL